MVLFCTALLLALLIVVSSFWFKGKAIGVAIKVTTFIAGLVLAVLCALEADASALSRDVAYVVSQMMLLLYLAGFLVVGYGLWTFFQKVMTDTKAALVTFSSFFAFILLTVVMWYVSSDAVPQSLLDAGTKVSALDARIADTSIWVVMALGWLLIPGVIVLEVRGFIKKWL